MDPLRGCCGSEAGINLSMMELPDLPVNFRCPYLWLGIVMMMMKPFFKGMVGVWEHHHGLMRSKLGPSMAFTMYTLSSHLLGLLTFVSFQYGLQNQPVCLAFHRNDALVTGYILLILGFLSKACAFYTSGGSHLLGGSYFGIPSPVKKTTGDQYYHPYGTGAIMVYVGFSLLRARIAGVLLTFLLMGSYVFAFQYERHHLLSKHPGLFPPLPSLKWLSLNVNGITLHLSEKWTNVKLKLEHQKQRLTVFVIRDTKKQ